MPRRWWRALPRAVFFLAVPGVAAPGGAAQGSAREELKPALAEVFTGNYAEATVLFEEALQVRPKDPLLNYYLGMCWFYRNERPRARSYLEKAVELEAEFPQAYYWLGRLHLLEGREEAAMVVLNQGLRRFPRNRQLRTARDTLEDRLQP